MIRVILLCLALTVSLFGNYAQDNSAEQIKKDFEKSETDKYKYDNFVDFSETRLLEAGILKQGQTLTRSFPEETFSFYHLSNANTCDDLADGYTGTIYDVNLRNGTVTCMFATLTNMRNPMGVFSVHYPEVKAHYQLDKKQAKIDQADAVKKAVEQFQPLYDKKKEISASMKNVANDSYLNIPQLFTATILTDTDIIDVEATQATGNIQLKDSYTSSFIDENTNQKSDNTKYLLTDATTIFKVYTGLSSISIDYLILLVILFGIYGIGRAVLSPLADKAEGQQNGDKKIPFTTGIIAGILLFFPTSDHENITNSSGETIAQYEIMKTRYQDFEKAGYYLFSEWASDSCKVIIDAEMEAIIQKSGLATQDQIINTYSGMILNQKLYDFYKDYAGACEGSVYDYDEMTAYDGEKIYSETYENLYPMSENWAYAASVVNVDGENYYKLSPEGLTLKSGYSKIYLANTEHSIESFYPLVAFSSCRKANVYESKYYKKIQEYRDELNRLLQNNKSPDQNKINMLLKLIEFQYGLFREWGYLSILGLPVTKMQTEYIGGLYEAKNSEVIEKLNAQIKGDSDTTHMIMSSIPYMFIPGSGTVYKVISDNSGKFGSAAGATAGSGIFSVITGAIGGIVGTVGGSAMGMWGAYNVAKTVLELIPIIGVVIIGLVRFLIILIKIFSFHLVSLFLMPIMFAKENLQAISKFTVKIIATMLELPIFVLAVWLAITANSLIHSIGDAFSKKIILGMLENSEVQYTNVETSLLNNAYMSKIKIYVFDGFMEIAIAVFAIIIIYKLIISLHNTIFEVLEVQGSQSLDNSIESMKNEASGWGSRV